MKEGSWFNKKVEKVVPPVIDSATKHFLEKILKYIQGCLDNTMKKIYDYKCVVGFGTFVVGIYFLRGSVVCLYDKYVRTQESKIKQELDNWSLEQGNAKKTWRVIVIGLSTDDNISDGIIIRIHSFLRDSKASFNEVPSFLDLCQCISRCTNYSPYKWKLMKLIAKYLSFTKTDTPSEIVCPAWNNINTLFRECPYDVYDVYDNKDVFKTIAYIIYEFYFRLDKSDYPLQPFPDELLERLRRVCKESYERVKSLMCVNIV